MKLLNYTTSYLAVILLVILSVWAVIFYYAMLDEIYDSIDDGLDNQKLLVMQRAATDSAVLKRTRFEDGYYKIREVAPGEALRFTDQYRDTLMYMQNERDFEPVRMLVTVFRQNGHYYEMRIITSMVEEDDLVTSLFYSLLWLYLGLLGTILFLNNFVLRKIWRPFYRLLQRIQHFQLEQPGRIVLENTRIDEFRLLNRSVEKLLQSNIDTYQSQKKFIENAAHELQTPLAISLNKLELLAEGQNLSEEQWQIVGKIINNLERMTRLNKSLLLLSKIENRQFADEEEVNMNRLVLETTEDFSDLAAHKKVTLHLKEEGSCVLNHNPGLAGIMVNNLIKNAIIHNFPGGYVNIYLYSDRLRIENSGKEGRLTENIFTRFYKEGTSAGSTGLGLPIVKAIATLYGHQVKYEYCEKHVITVIFHVSGTR